VACLFLYWFGPALAQERKSKGVLGKEGNNFVLRVCVKKTYFYLLKILIVGFDLLACYYLLNIKYI